MARAHRVLLTLAALIALAAVPAFAQAGMAQKLKAMGGKPCSTTSEFTCVKITVPLDHFDAANTKRIKVAFAVRPADGTSKGLYVTATGGPGSSGIASADSYANSFVQGVLDRFDPLLFRGGILVDRGEPFLACGLDQLSEAHRRSAGAVRIGSLDHRLSAPGLRASSGGGAR